MAQATDSVLEILDTGGSAHWSAVPGTPVAFSLSIRNGTQDAHEFELTLAEQVDWLRLNPARIALGPGAEAITTLHVSIPESAQLAAGDHQIVVELHDFEGTSFGGLVSTLRVAPVHKLNLQVSVRGPLMRRSVVEGFVLHCVVLNRGNAECAVQTLVDGGPDIAFQAPNVRVPSGAEIGFDIEARWTWEAVSAYPSIIRIVARHAQGEVQATVGWDAVAAALGSAVPPLREAEEFPEILPRQRLEPLQVFAPQQQTGDGQLAQTQAPLEIDKQLPLQPVRVQVNGPSPIRSSFGRRINPWWPPAERLGRRWHVKILPVLAVFVLIATLLLSRVDTGTVGRALTPYQTLSTLLHSAWHRPAVNIMRVSPLAGDKPAASLARGAQHAAAVPHTGKNYARFGNVSGVRSQRLASPVVFPKGSTWQGPVVHVSATNIKVYNEQERLSRSFILTPGFKVYSSDGRRSYPMTVVRPGTHVRIVYSYTFGIRHANAIFIKPPKR